LVSIFFFFQRPSKIGSILNLVLAYLGHSTELAEIERGISVLHRASLAALGHGSIFSSPWSSSWQLCWSSRASRHITLSDV